jgi:hypothetical protein
VRGGARCVLPSPTDTQTFRGTATISGTTLVDPRAHSESQVEFPPFAIGAKAGGVLRAEGLSLRVLRVNDDSDITKALLCGPRA